MTIFDRYLLRTFAKVLVVSFLSLTGLYVIIDLFGNLEEFISYAEREGSLLAVLGDYYGARVLSFFDRTSGLLALIAAIFTVTWFQRTNELTAVTAAGIPKARIVRPLIVATSHRGGTGGRQPGNRIAAGPRETQPQRAGLAR